jgi:hypothetical protein
MTRFLALLAALSSAGSLEAVPPRGEAPLPSMWVFVGTYTDKDSKGIYRFFMRSMKRTREA